MPVAARCGLSSAGELADPLVRDSGELRDAAGAQPGAAKSEHGLHCRRGCLKGGDLRGGPSRGALHVRLPEEPFCRERLSCAVARASRQRPLICIKASFVNRSAAHPASHMLDRRLWGERAVTLLPVKSGKKRPGVGPARVGPLRTDAYDIQYARRHKSHDPNTPVPARLVMSGWPPEIRARVRAVIIAVAAAPPLQFSGGPMWQAMHGDMGGYFEVRCRQGKMLYRVFCLLDPDPVVDATGARHGKNVLAIVTAGAKKNETAFTEAFYADVRRLGDEYKANTPRCWG